MTEIRSRIMRRGDPCESTWPSQFGSGEKGVFHIDPSTGECVEGYPEPEVQKFGQAPVVILDEMPPARHQGTDEILTSRKEWELRDRITGTATHGRRPRVVDRAHERRAARQVDIRQSRERATVELDKNEHPITEQFRAYAKERNKVLSQRLGIDAENIAGRNSGRRRSRKPRAKPGARSTGAS